MKKDVLISIKGVYNSEDDRDVIELFTTGQYYKRKGCYYICYEESEATGFEGSTTTLKVEEEKMVTLERTGSANSQLIVERGVRHQCHYDVGCGDLLVGVLGSKIKSSLTDKGGNLEIKYSLDFNSMYSSENEMYIHIKMPSSSVLKA
ncbi:MAG: DUF1934 domain-containing protein [Oscillospiraceae bacterium]|nr:DUF1934 domain-containing protein [Oscillospiraceae bacterium]